MRKQTLLRGGLAILVALSLAGCNAPSTTSGKLSVVASFDAIAELTRAIGGDKVEVVTLTPAGVEPHDFEPKAQDMATLSKASVFVFNGLGMEAWAEKAVGAAGNSKLIAVDASLGAEPIANTEPEEIEEHGQYDPHLWLSLSGAAVEVNNIAAALSKADPQNAEAYAANLKDFLGKLDALKSDYGTKYQAAKKRSFVTGHAAFAYFCRDFGLTQESVEDAFAEGEPSARDLAKLVEYCRKNHITTIFAEEMVSPRGIPDPGV